MVFINKFVLLTALGAVFGTDALLTNPINTKTSTAPKVNPAG